MLLKKKRKRKKVKTKKKKDTTKKKVMLFADGRNYQLKIQGIRINFLEENFRHQIELL
jgi:hypothetical protein